VDKADKLFLKGSYGAALTQYRLIEKNQPSNPKIKFRIGQVFLSIGQDSKALPYLEEAHRLNPAVDADIDYYLGMALQANAHFSRAIEHFKKFKKVNKKLIDIADHKIAQCRIGDSLKSNPVNCLIKVLEWPINSMYQDYGPMLNEEENELIFTSARDTVQKDKQQNVLFEDILISKIDSAGTWAVPERISSRINDDFHDAATYLTPNGRTIFLYYERGNGDIYQSDFDGKEWSVPRSMGKEINSVSWEASGSLSRDGKRFFFSSDRNGGRGGLDIYVSEKQPNGQWGKAVNLGPLINTPGNEDAPFLAEDGTLYFGSDGHIGLGDYDIYKSEFKNGKWTKPVNLGYPINTPRFENYFFLTKDKHRAYFSAMRDEGLGNSDICMITFIDPPPPPVVKEEPVVAKVDTVKREAETIGDEFVDAMVSFQKDLGLATVLTGKVIDESSAKPLKAQIILVDNKANKVIERVYSDSKTGDFKIVIPHGGNYGINTSVDGYLFNSLNFEVPAFNDYQEIETAIMMQKATVGSKVVMKNIFFDVGKALLKDESIGELERILDLLQRNPDLKLQINGHTDNSGDAQTNKLLSLNRAKAVLNFLVQRGVSVNRLSAVGFGEERPIVSNDDEEGGRAINRRTEIEVMN
jgi:outer membrane protein OmpA-like peptidoglycan-associated protein